MTTRKQEAGIGGQKKEFLPLLCRALSQNAARGAGRQPVFRPLSPEGGFSLIEMMISLTIGLIIIAAMTGVLAGNSRSAKTNDRTSELQSNGRYALDHLKRELRHAGYRGYTWAEPNVPTIAGVANECLDGGAANRFVTNIRQGVWGANDSNPYSANCLPAANYLRGDVLVIRRVSGMAATALATNTIYFRSAYAIGEVFQAAAAAAPLSGAPALAGTPLADFALQEYIYYIGRDDNDQSVPALRRVSLQANAMVDEMVVSGIEHMQVQYGRATTDMNTRYYDASNIAGRSTDTAPTEWDEVNAVRIWLLARNARAEPGYTNTGTYTMGYVPYGPVNDGFRRQVFTAVVQLRN